MSTHHKKKDNNNRKAFKFRASHTVETMSLLQGINKKEREIKRKITKKVQVEFSNIKQNQFKKKWINHSLALDFSL